ncbi:IclR family transcriptional regulator [Mesorhizobium sp. CAU 1732]|uniref:IclR family transcriptional regulator n=1 Tax=Mesorhizobium sp. CAU 1732 TaxID=3140358 RepID=UPI00326015C0
MTQTSEKSSPTEAGPVKSATRVLDLFEFLGRWDAEKTHTEIAEELAIPKSSLTQLLKTLVRRGYLNYVPSSKGYELGPSIAALAKRINESNDLVSIAQSALEWVTAETQETCALNFIKGDKSEVVACVMSPRRLLYHMRLGDMAPLYATSGGKALLAFLPAEMLREYLSRVALEQITPNTITSVKALENELEQVRAQGVAFVVEEFTPGIAGVARPILSASGHPLASINIAVPVARFDDAARDRCVATLAKAVETVSQRMRAGNHGTIR